MDFYGVMESKNKYKELLGAMDLATAEVRLFACRTRTAAVVTECVLHGIVLRDGCPLHIHSDAAREFISKAMNRLCTLLGCKQTTTLAHHPTGNASIERLWQFVAACLRVMTNEQYSLWEKYVRYMEHVWNTTYHSVLKCTPIEAAHGLLARSVLDTLLTNERNQPADLMTNDGISAMRDTARAFETQIKNLRTVATRQNAQLLRKGPKHSYQVGDEVSLFIPPSDKQAKAMGRKPKHLLCYRGPAFITEVLSNSTYELLFEGRTYFRCFGELRPYKSTKLPVDLPIANDIAMQENNVVVGNYVTLCDTDDEDDDRFHLCQVIAIQDNNAVLLNHATWSPNIKMAVFSVMYQLGNTRYTTEKPKQRAKEHEVIDRVPLDEADGYIDHYDVKLTKTMRITAKSLRQLAKLGLRHHILGQTFP